MTEPVCFHSAENLYYLVEISGFPNAAVRAQCICSLSIGGATILSADYHDNFAKRRLHTHPFEQMKAFSLGLFQLEQNKVWRPPSVQMTLRSFEGCSPVRHELDRDFEAGTEPFALQSPFIAFVKSHYEDAFLAYTVLHRARGLMLVGRLTTTGYAADYFACRASDAFEVRRDCSQQKRHWRLIRA
jgi:hypothetical protein